MTPVWILSSQFEHIKKIIGQHNFLSDPITFDQGPCKDCEVNARRVLYLSVTFDRFNRSVKSCCDLNAGHYFFQIRHFMFCGLTRCTPSHLSEPSHQNWEVPSGLFYIISARLKVNRGNCRKERNGSDFKTRKHFSSMLNCDL